ncbi:FAD-dependent oxidoreductase [Deinococcus multiflagellatus]|nr:FAD-dependent oxidoreductase [Deinococcus multiflagellatus]
MRPGRYTAGHDHNQAARLAPGTTPPWRHGPIGHGAQHADGHASLSFSCPRIRADLNDGTDSWHLSAAQVRGAQAITRPSAFCRASPPGCGAAHLDMVAPMVGSRETRRIAGDGPLTLAGRLNCARFPGSICRNHSPANIHSRHSGKLIHERRGRACPRPLPGGSARCPLAPRSCWRQGARQQSV